ncbi:Dctn4 [Blepharisma stoltei]|uniref:Dynactin subunit 4 n=1 Tax=Blepharisma stoltei TaxID=1481888 RepID=A0AAU9IDE0_9CILI|nr:unnamed protein product [Blepharisma stoltei]
MWRATSWNPPYIHLQCGCGKEWGLEDMFFCFPCSKALCPYCVTEEIDSFYCRNCMENMPNTEAFAFKNKCARCFQCPACFSTLQILLNSTRQQKLYHFGCQSCYWDSMSLGLFGNSLNELLMSNQDYFMKDNPLQDQLKILIDTYKEACRNRRKIGVKYLQKETWTFEDLENSVQPKPLINPVQRIEHQSPGFDELLNEDINYNEITSMQQRLSNAGAQPRELNKASAQPIPLLTRRSKRCKYCKKYVVKPETNQSFSNPFKMENLLVYFFPRIYIREIKSNSLILLLINPTAAVAYIRLEGDKVPPSELHLDSYDPVMDLVTSEGSSLDESLIIEREKNTISIEVGKPSNDIWISAFWKFMRGQDVKEFEIKIHIKLA